MGCSHSCRKGSLRVSGSGDSRTVSESGDMPLSHSPPFPHEHEGASKPALSQHAVPPFLPQASLGGPQSYSVLPRA